MGHIPFYKYFQSGMEKRPDHIILLFCLLLIGRLSHLQAQPPRLILPIGHIGGVHEALFSPDHKQVLTRDRFEVARLWDAQTGYLLANLYGHSGQVYRMGFSRDGKKLFTGSTDSSIIIWDARTASPLLTLRGHQEIISSGSFDYTGNYFISGSRDQQARIWDLSTGKTILQLGKGIQNGEVMAVSFNRNGDKVKTMAGGSWFYWDSKTGKLLAKKSYDEKQDKFVPVLVTGKDSSYLDDENTQWKSPSPFPDPGFVLKYNLDSNEVLVTDSSGKKIITRLTGHTNMSRLLYYSRNGDTLYIEPDDKNYTTAWYLPTQQMTRTILYKGITRPNAYRGDDNKHVFFNNERTIGLIGTESDIVLWDLVKNSRIPQFQQKKQLPKKISHAFFSTDSKYLLTIIYADSFNVVLWEVATGKILARLPFPEEDLLTYCCFSADNTQFALFGTSGSILIYDRASLQKLKEIKGEEEKRPIDMIGGEFSPDKTLIFSLDTWANFQLFDTRSGNRILSLNEPGNTIRAAQFTADSKGMFLSTSGSLVKRFDLRTQKVLYHFFPVDSTDYFTQTPEGYYQASSAAARLLHYVTPDLRVISFEQLDVKYNRPDKVLEAIGSRDTALIRSYRKAWEKRIRRLGIDTTAFRDGFGVPQCDIVNREELTREQKTGSIRLRIRATDSTYKLDRFNVWVNEVPVFGQRGISIRRRNSNRLDTTITIRLSRGSNRVEATVTNMNGTESFRMPVFFNYTVSTHAKESLRFIGIGIDRFAQSQYNLRYSSKDIRDLALQLKKKYGEAVTIDTLFDEKVNTAAVKKLKEKLLQTTVDDKVIMAYSGHGLLSRDYDYYLSTYAVNFDKPEEKGLPYEELENLLDSIPARKKLLLIDACHSGEVDKEELVRINSTSDSLRLIKGLQPVGYKQEGQLGLKNSFELMQNLFVNVGKSTGATVISAAAGTQFALERNDLQNGVFTYSILEAMRQKTAMKISELKKIVGERVVQITNGLQKPTSRNEVITADWNIW